MYSWRKAVGGFTVGLLWVHKTRWEKLPACGENKQEKKPARRNLKSIIVASRFEFVNKYWHSWKRGKSASSSGLVAAEKCLSGVRNKGQLVVSLVVGVHFVSSAYYAWLASLVCSRWVGLSAIILFESSFLFVKLFWVVFRGRLRV